MLRCDMRHKGKELCPEGHKDITFVAVILSNTCKPCKQIGYLTWRKKKKATSSQLRKVADSSLPCKCKGSPYFYKQII